MTPDTVVTLGDFEFKRFEVPEVIPFGTEQHLNVRVLPGGVKVVDAMGATVPDLEWSGRFQGEGALQRARYLEGLVNGKELKLTWSELSYRVVVKSFKADFERAYQLPYRISCEVIENTAAPVTSLPAGVDEQMSDDMAGASALGAKVGDGPLSQALGALDKAISQVNRFATATQDALNSVLAPIAAVQDRVQTLIGSAGNTLQNFSTLGGLIPGNPLGELVSGLTGQVAAMNSLPDLYALDGLMNRMTTNIAAVGASGSVLTVAGGDLYRTAAAAYGDASGWTAIARANRLTDPLLDGVRVLTVPPQSDGADGVLTI